MKGVVILAKMRKSSKDVKRLRNAIKSAKATATKAQKLGQDVIFDDVRTIKSFKTRKEFNKYLRNVEKFNKQNRYVMNEKGIVFNRNDIEQANKIIDIQNKQRNKMRRKVVNLRETEGGILTPIKVVNANGRLWQDSMHFFTPVKHININTYTSSSQLKTRITALKRNKSIEKKMQRFQDNYKKAIEAQLKQKVLTKKQAEQMINDLEKLTPKDFTIWYEQERITKQMFNYLDLSAPTVLSMNQLNAMYSFARGMVSDVSMISQSLGLKSGRLKLVDGKVVEKR